MARRLRAERRGGAIVLVALTGYGQDEDRRRAREAGFDHHLVKPVGPETLLAVSAPTPPFVDSPQPPGQPKGN